MKTISNEKRLNAVAQKVILQINCKLGGELWGCKTPYQNLMVCGIDVFHDKSRKSASISGMVTSMNDALSRYFTTVKIQKPSQELIDTLKVWMFSGWSVDAPYFFRDFRLPLWKP